jgi:hypothetical protein
VARRRAIGIAGGVIAVILGALLVRGCLDARQERAFQDYVQEVSSLVAESGQESEALFELLEDPRDLGAVDVQNSLNGLSVDAQRLVERAGGADPPGELSEAQERVVQTLELRRDGLGGIAQDIPAALGDEQREEAIESIASQMQSFLASDVIYTRQAVPRIEEALDEEELTGEVDPIPEGQFLPDLDWLQADTVRAAVDQIRLSGGDAQATPGLHGNGLAGVTVQPSGQALTEGTTTEISGTEDLAFDVQVQNQGANDEEGITVTVEIGTDEPIVLEGSLEAIAAGTTETVSVPVEEPPPTGEELELSVQIEPVPGEEVTDNNEASYGVLFNEAP